MLSVFADVHLFAMILLGFIVFLAMRWEEKLVCNIDMGCLRAGIGQGGGHGWL